MMPLRPLRLLLLLWISLLPREGRCDPLAQGFQQHYDRAISLSESGHFAEALTEFVAAYQARQELRVHIQIGRMHQRLSDLREALRIYREIDNDPRRSAAEGVKVRSYIKETEAQLQAQEREEEARRARKRDEDARRRAEQARTRAEQARTRRLRVSGWAALGLGLAVTAAGAALLGLDCADATTNSVNPGCKSERGTRGPGIGLLGGGAALIGIGAGTVLGLGYRKEATGGRTVALSLTKEF